MNGLDMIDTSWQVLYFILVIIGLFLIGAEIFLPGGIIGILGGASLLAAMVVGFYAFPPPYGFVSALMIIVLSGVCLVVWVKYFPKTRFGKNMTLSEDGKAFKSSAPDVKQVGHEGTALSILRPAGIATIDGKRVDVVAEGSWIDSGKPIRIVHVEGARIIVREIGAPPAPKAES